MRLWILPVVTVGLAVMALPNSEPNERQMRDAFAEALESRVRSVIEYSRETGGEAAVLRIRQAGTDRFAISEFRKLTCLRKDGVYACSFAVGLDLADGVIRRTLSGRFVESDRGYVFAGDL